MSSISEQNMDDRFDAKRTELLSLLNKSDEIVERLNKSGYFPSETEYLRNIINITRQRCHEGLFSIALIAAFQSGKSTTINAFADGREIAPRGLGTGGIKTSACLVKVQNPNQGEKETAKITWRSHKDLLLRLDEILGVTACQIPDSEISKKLRLIKQQKEQSQTDKERESFNQEYFSIIDFQTLEGRSLLQQALNEELKNYNESENKGSEEVRDRLDLLRFAMIVLAYYDDPSLSSLQRRNDYQPKDIENYLKFPKEFEKRWNKCFSNFKETSIKQEFSLPEVMYAFIEEVTYIVNSVNLKKSGAQIIDCPGLFVSRYDTLIALKAMQESSAILYLLSIDKQLADSEIKTLNTIKDAGHLNKVFFVLNYRKNPDASKEVISEISEQLKNLGFTASYQTELLYFNAFLALRAMQGEKLLDNNLDAYSQEQIKLDTEAMLGEKMDSVGQAWLGSVEEVLTSVLSRLRRREIIPLEFTKKSVQDVRSESKWDNLTDLVNKYVFETKAWSVLVDKGSEPVISTLVKTEASLQLAEESVKKSLEEAQEDWKNAREKLAEFQSSAEEIIEYHIDDSWEVLLAKSFFKEVYTPSIKATGMSAAPKIADEATIGNALRDPLTLAGNAIADGINSLTEGFNTMVGGANWFFKQSGSDITINNIDIDKIPKSETLKERCAEIIRKELDSNISIKSQGWFNSLKKGGNKDYEQKILRKIVKVYQLIAQKWTSLDLNHNSYLQGLEVNIPEFSGEIQRDLEKYREQATDAAIDKPFQDISIFFASLYFLFFFDLLFPGLGVALFTAAVLLIVIASRFKSRDEYMKDIANKITEELNKGVNSNQLAIMDKIEEQLKVIPDFYLRSLADSLERMSFQLEQRIEEANKNLNKNQVEKEKIAEIAKTFRQDDIEVLRKEIARFQSSVEEIWKKPS